MAQPSPNADLSADVVVIGGGPGGSAAATMLARKGWRVLLLERERFPRNHVGESLLPASIPVLEELGALPAIEAQGFLPKWGATMVWGKESAPWSWYFKETNQRHPHSYQVWRPRFDELLLDNARQNGVDVRQGSRATRVLFDDADPAGGGSRGRASGVEYVAGVDAGDQRRGVARARFVVDASGQGVLLGRQLGLRRWDSFFRNLAVYGYYAGAKRLPEPDATNIFIESYPHGWLWVIPLHTGLASVGAVVDRRSGESGLREHAPDRFLADQIGQAPHTAQLLEPARLESGPFVVKDWSYACEDIAGDGYVLLGDAACFIDPLFSSGVHLALMSGVLAAAYVSSALKDPGMAGAAGKVYQELYYKEYHHFREMVRLFYSSNRTSDSYFWEARRLLEGDETLSPRHSFIQAVAGQPPRGYERAVLERGVAPASFADSVRAVELERAAHQAQIEAALSEPDITQSTLYRAVPRLRPGVKVERKPVLADGEFVWGYVLITEGHPEGLPCSGLVATLVSLVDGRASVAELLDALCRGADAAQIPQIGRSALAALRILYIDGTIEELRGL